MDNISEGFIDIIESETTFMSQICKHIITYNNTLSENFKQEMCKNWFIDTLKHCTIKILNPTGTASAAITLLLQFFNLNRLFKSKSLKNILIASHPHIKIEPQLMTSNDCNQFFIEIAKDYIFLAPKLTTCSEELSYIGTLIRAFLGLIILYIFYRIFKYYAYGNLRKIVWEITSENEQKLFKQLFYEKKHKAINGLLLRNTIYECKYLKYHNFRPINIIPQQPTIVFKIGKQKLLNSLCGYIKSPPIFQGYENYTISNELVTSREYAEEKIRKFVKESGKLRIILEYDIINSDDDFDDDDNDYNKIFDDYYYWKRQLRLNRKSELLLNETDKLPYNNNNNNIKLPPSDGINNITNYLLPLLNNNNDGDNIKCTKRLEKINEQTTDDYLNGDNNDDNKKLLNNNNIQIKSRKYISSRYNNCYCNLFHKKSSRNILKTNSTNGTINNFISCHEVRITKNFHKQLNKEYSKNCLKKNIPENKDLFWNVVHPSNDDRNICNISELEINKNIDKTKSISNLLSKSSIRSSSKTPFKVKSSPTMRYKKF